MKQFEWPFAVKFTLVLIAAFALSTWIDPYLSFHSPWANQAVNAVLPVLLMLFIWGLAGRAWVALVLEFVVLLVLRYVDHTKKMYLDVDLVYADFTVIGGLMKDPKLVLGFLHPTWAKFARYALVVIVLAVAWWLLYRRLPAAWRRRRGMSWFPRLFCLVLAVLGTTVLLMTRAPDVIDRLNWQVYSQVNGSQSVGVAGNVLLGRMTERDKGPRPSRKAEQAFWNEPAVRAAEAGIQKEGNGQRPDIVIIQSEALFEPAQLCGFPDTPVLQRVAMEKPEGMGNLEVPVFGGRTLQTEFEVLSGAPISYYPGSMFAYYELVNHHFDALPNVLRSHGYSTIAMHPNNRGFWNRDAAFPDMGFDSFQDIGSFIYPHDYSDRGHVRDAALMRTLLAELDSASKPTFIMAITMDNHFPWGNYAPGDDSSLGLPKKLNGAARKQMADYVVHAVDADNAYGFLLDALKRRGRPVIVLFYGDHLPALFPVYQQLCFKDGKPPQKHLPPYRVWANFPIPTPPRTTPAYLLQGWLMQAAGLPLNGHVLADALAGDVAHDKAVSAADRKRVLSEYANIAAANVRADVKHARKAGRKIFIGRDRALKVLDKLREKNAEAGTSVSEQYGDLYFHSSKGGQQPIAFNLQAGVSSLTLRPYLGSPTQACMERPSDIEANFAVEGDGRTLYRARLTAQTVRLATLDLRGIRQLKLLVDAPPSTNECAQVYVRVPQMTCYSADCTVPGPTSELPSNGGSSRILTADPADGDTAALNILAPENLKLAGPRMANIRWLLSRKKAEQQGLLPFSTDRDAQLLMHPADDHSAWMEFDVAGIDKLLLTPRINPLSNECKAMNQPGKEAGVVGLTVMMDGKPVVPRFIVDRTYKDKLSIATQGGRTLRIEVDKGNDVTWCDWFSVGVDKLEGASVPTAPSSPLPDVPAAVESIPPQIDH